MRTAISTLQVPYAPSPVSRPAVVLMGADVLFRDAPASCLDRPWRPESLGAIAAGLDPPGDIGLGLGPDPLSKRMSFSTRPLPTPSNSSGDGTSTAGRGDLGAASRPPDTRDPCPCMRTQSANLCALRTIERRRGPARVDTVLSCTRVVCTAAESHLGCATCRTDPNPVPTLYLTLLTFQLLFRCAGAAAHPPDRPCPVSEPGMGFQMGLYEPTTDEARALKDVLVNRALERIQRALLGLKERVERAAQEMKARDTRGERDLGPGWDVERCEMRNLLALLQTLWQTSVSFATRLRGRSGPGL